MDIICVHFALRRGDRMTRVMHSFLLSSIFKLFCRRRKKAMRLRDALQVSFARCASALQFWTGPAFHCSSCSSSSCHYLLNQNVYVCACQKVYTITQRPILSLGYKQKDQSGVQDMLKALSVCQTRAARLKEWRQPHLTGMILKLTYTIPFAVIP